MELKQRHSHDANKGGLVKLLLLTSHHLFPFRLLEFHVYVLLLLRDALGSDV